MEASLQLTAALRSQSAAADPVATPRLVPQSAAPGAQGSAVGAPHILLIAASSLASTARLAIELHRSGAAVSLVAPPGHPARVLRFFKQLTTHDVWQPWKLLEKCLRRWTPDAIIPCDERTVRDLHELHARTGDRAICAMVERSLGAPSIFATVRSRDRLLSLARAIGVRVPESMSVPDEATLDVWLRRQPAPFVMKADGSWAGFGVRIISDKRVAHQAWQQMRQPTSFYMGLRALLLDRDAFGVRSWAQSERPVLSVQSYIDGWPANIGVACWHGEVLATNCAEAVSTLSATGPSTVARIIQNSEMVDAAKGIVRELGLSGLIGFDFMVEAASGHAYLIEMNPRVTPICTIPLGLGHDLPDALTACLAGRMPQDRPPRTDCEIIAYFPDTWRQDPSNRLLQAGFHDVPWDEPDLVRRLMQPDAIERNLVFRQVRHLRRHVSAAAR
ncbi:MAG: ATP-grasp domain-containing protein [Rhodopila sp.]